jgi:hypothetical protein
MLRPFLGHLQTPTAPFGPTHPARYTPFAQVTCLWTGGGLRTTAVPLGPVHPARQTPLTQAAAFA